MNHGLRPIVDDEDERAIAALSDEERAALDAWAETWDTEALEWARRRAATRRMLAICLPTAAASVAVLKVVGA
jgi:uncharacterized protein YdaU (DUF1376 family)